MVSAIAAACARKASIAPRQLGTNARMMLQLDTGCSAYRGEWAERASELGCAIVFRAASTAPETRYEVVQRLGPNLVHNRY
eukprot:3098555-Rhodomonas_salina.5